MQVKLENSFINIENKLENSFINIENKLNEEIALINNEKNKIQDKKIFLRNIPCYIMVGYLTFSAAVIITPIALTALLPFAYLISFLALPILLVTGGALVVTLTKEADAPYWIGKMLEFRDRLEHIEVDLANLMYYKNNLHEKSYQKILREGDICSDSSLKSILKISEKFHLYRGEYVAYNSPYRKTSTM